MVVIAVGIPAAYHISGGFAWNDAPEGVELKNILIISRGIAIILLLLYVVYLVFQLYTQSVSLTSLLAPVARLTSLRPFSSAYLYKTLPPIQRRRLEASMPHAGPSPPGSHVFRLPSWVPSHFGSSSSGSSVSSGASVRARRTSDADTQDGHQHAHSEANPQDEEVPDVLVEEEEDDELEIPQLTSIQVRSDFRFALDWLDRH